MWLELHIKTNAQYAKILGDQLTLLDAMAVTFQDGEDQPIYEPDPENPLFWDETIVTGLFPQETSLQPILNYLEQQQTNGLIQNFKIQPLANQDWSRMCLDQFQPLQFGKRLWICPSWSTIPDSTATNVIMDPGLAFGTGTHPTTKLCLEWLEQNIKNEQLVVDYGCGSGILGLAALKLGAKKVIAIDHDPQALDATKQNGLRNDFIPPFLETKFPNELVVQKCDLLIANILKAPLLSLVTRFKDLVEPGHPIVLSGLLQDQVDEIIQGYDAWFDFSQVNFLHEWACLTGFRK